MKAAEEERRGCKIGKARKGNAKRPGEKSGRKRE